MIFVLKVQFFCCILVYLSTAQDFTKKTRQHVTFTPYQCKLMTYDMDRALYRYQLSVVDENNSGGSCNVSTDFFASKELLTPEIYIPNPLPSISLPYQLCTQQVTGNFDIPKEFEKFLNHSWVEGQNVSFVNLQQGNRKLENYTCYQGWRYQILFNNCSQEVKVDIKIDSGGDEDDLYSKGCVEGGYEASYLALGLVFIISFTFNCTCCCCLFCKCCLPCARFFARIDPKKLITEASSRLGSNDKKQFRNAISQLNQNRNNIYDTDKNQYQGAQNVEDVVQVLDVEVDQGAKLRFNEINSRTEILQVQQNSSDISQFNNQNQSLPPVNDQKLTNKFSKIDQKEQNSQDDFQIEVQDAQNLHDVQKKNKKYQKKQKVKEINKRIKLYSTEGQSRWLTFCISIANLIYLYMQLYPPQFEHDPYRVDYSQGASICGQDYRDRSAGYVVRLCDIATIFFNSFFLGVSTFIIVQANYTTRQDPWFIFRTAIATTVLIILDCQFAVENIIYFYRSKYVEQPVGYKFAGIIVWIHLIAANFIFLYVIILGFGQQTQQTRILEQNSLLKKTLTIEKQNQQEIQQEQKTRFQQFQNWLFGFWEALKEVEGFKYSIFMLISVTAASYLIIFIFISLMYKRTGYLDCLKDFNDCIWHEMESHIVFIQKGRGLDTVQSLISDSNVTQLDVQNVNNAIAQMEESILMVNPEYQSTIQSTIRQISKIVDDTGSLLERTQSVIIRTQENTNKWSETIDTPFMIASGIGLTFGLLMGMGMLYVTLVNYKKLTIHLALEKVLMALSGDDQKHQSETLEHTLENFTAVGSIFFFGIVLSTSAFQMYIFSFVFTFILTVLFSPWFWTVFLRDYWGYVAVYGGYILMNMFIVVPLGKRFLSQKDQSIKYPALFLAYYIVFSFAYLLLGTLMAVWRIVYLLLTSLIAINRLDISLFTILPVLDNGHKAFMGMVLLSQAMAGVGHTQTRQQRKAKNNWKKLREAVQDEKGQLLEKLMTNIFETVEHGQVQEDEDEYESTQGDDNEDIGGELQGQFVNTDGEQIATLRRILHRSRTGIDELDASRIPKAQIVMSKSSTLNNL